MAISLQFCPLFSISVRFSPETKVFNCRKPLSVRCNAAESPSPSGAAVDSEFDAKVFRKNLTRSENYNRKGFGRKEETLELMNREYTSDIIKTLKENGYEYTWGNVTVKLAESYGFCWGVERAVQIAYEARTQFPDEKIWITNEIIHNPTVNKRLEDMEVKDIPIADGKKQFDVVDKGDVVILPAFGAAVDEMLVLSEKNVQIVDTTCPWVSKVLFPHTDQPLPAFKTLRVAKSTATGTLEWYKILQVEPFSHINIIKKQYKKLALTLHPDKNPFAASEEAFKLVGEAFRVLSDKIRRKEYDMKLRIAMQAAAEVTLAVSVETFWTACSTCRLLHQFERRYLGHNLMCPSCKKSFKAVEASDNNLVDNGRIGERMKTRSSSAGVRIKFRNSERKLKMSSVGEILKRAESTSFERSDNVNKIGNENLSCGGSGAVIEGLRSKRVRKLRTLDKNEEASSRVVVSERLKAKKRAKTGEEMMTLAEMQMLAKRKSSEKKLKDKEKDKGKERRDTCGSSKGESSETEKRSSKKGISNRTSKSGSLKIMVVEDSEEKDKGMEKRDTCGSSKGESSETEKRSSKKGNSNRTSKSGGLEIMVVEDSDFYDFDRDRVERSFRKGQVWAIYDDDGMPRHYGLIDDVVSVSPFEVKMSWLDLQNDLDEALICWEKLGFHICCGRFKVSRKTSVNSLNIFSHVVDCDRAARELYRIYPKKGSVWALYNENALDTEGRNVIVKDKRCYDIVIFLTSYSEIHGLSMAYLEKVNGFKTVFKRREIGCHAIKWLEKNDVRLFSHQIPARKLSAEETSGIAKDCWELDPASLPPELLTIGW